MTKTVDQRIAETREKIRQNENQIKQLVQKQKEMERKVRTRRLIERGAILESVIASSESLTNEDIKFILAAALKSEAASAALISIGKRRSDATVAEPEEARGTGA